AEATLASLGLTQGVEVDLDVEHLLHAADVRPPQLLVCVDERTGPGDAGGGVHDLVAVHSTTAALGLVLRPQRKLLHHGQAPLHCHGFWGTCGQPARLDITAGRV